MTNKQVYQEEFRRLYNILVRFTNIPLYGNSLNNITIDQILKGFVSSIYHLRYFWINKSINQICQIFIPNGEIKIPFCLSGSHFAEVGKVVD